MTDYISDHPYQLRVGEPCNSIHDSSGGSEGPMSILCVYFMNAGPGHLISTTDVMLVEGLQFFYLGPSMKYVCHGPKSTKNVTVCGRIG